MNINLNNGISADFTLMPKKNKTDNTQYCIYIAFYIYQNGIKQYSHSISTGATVNIDCWVKGQVAGRGDKAKLINDYLIGCMNKAKELLTKLSLKKIKTCSDVLSELKLSAKQQITGKAPRAQKNEFISKLKDYTYGEILKRYFNDNELSADRKRNYLFTEGLLNEYFNSDTPTIDLITTEDLISFKRFICKRYRNQNTATTFLAMVAALFTYAVKLQIITPNPIPENFRGSFKDGNREVLSEQDCFKIMNLEDAKLKKTEQVAKCCLLVQMLTGIGYGDLKKITHANIKFDETAQQYIIEKERNKTGVRFVVNLTANGLYYVRKLKELTGNEHAPFNLPSIEYISRMYKAIGKKAEVKTVITTYTLRHTFAVNFMEHGGRLEDLQVRLGHTDIKTTQIYGKISAKRNAETTNQLETRSKLHQLQQPVLIAV